MQGRVNLDDPAVQKEICVAVERSAKYMGVSGVLTLRSPDGPERAYYIRRGTLFEESSSEEMLGYSDGVEMEREWLYFSASFAGPIPEAKAKALVKKALGTALKIEKRLLSQQAA